MTDIDSLRARTRALCAQFPDEYWRETDRNRRYPQNPLAGQRARPTCLISSIGCGVVHPLLRSHPTGQFRSALARSGRAPALIWRANFRVMFWLYLAAGAIVSHGVLLGRHAAGWAPESIPTKLFVEELN